MRGLGWTLLAVGSVAGALALDALLAPVPVHSDLAGFSLLATAAWCIFFAASLLLPRGWWTWAFPAAWLGLAIGALVLAYKDSFLEELAYFGAPSLAAQMALHALVAPIEVFLGFAVGFVDPQGAAIVLACLAFALLGGELIRRRLWPRASGSAPTPSAAR